ncbi:MAG TPA: hypothetical protein VN653_10770 [Anaerolineales bacterium]|nr:hypothetical protein [Anaerolineales bacterium]
MSAKQKSLASLLEQYAPKPSQRFYTRMANSPWNRKEKISMSSVRRFTLGAAFVLATLAAFTLAVPSVRASISAFLRLGVSPSDTIIQPTGTLDLSTPVSTIPATQPAATPQASTPAPSGNLDLSADPNIQQVTGLADWSILTPRYLSQGYHFDSAYYDSTNQLIYLSFLATRSLEGSDLTETKTISLAEAKHNDIVPLMVAPSTTIQDVTVAGAPAAYAIGAWDSTFVQNASEPNGGHMEWVWRNDLQIQNLFLQKGDVYLVLITDDTQVSQNELLQIAESIGR